MPILTDAYPTLVDIAGTTLHEKNVTPPPVQGGGANDTTTMRNTRWRTRFPKKLLTLGEMTFTCAYDPEAYEDILNNIQVNQLVTVTFSDGSTLAFWGWLDEFTPGAIEEGTQPEATVTIIASNMDDSLSEVAPVYTEGTGT